MCRIAINLAIDTHRRKRPQIDLDETLPDSSTGPVEQAEKEMRAKMVRQALANLPAASRAALMVWLMPAQWTSWGLFALSFVLSAALAVLYLGWLGYEWRYGWGATDRFAHA